MINPKNRGDLIKHLDAAGRWRRRSTKFGRDMASSAAFCRRQAREAVDFVRGCREFGDMGAPPIRARLP